MRGTFCAALIVFVQILACLFVVYAVVSSAFLCVIIPRFVAIPIAEFDPMPRFKGVVVVDDTVHSDPCLAVIQGGFFR